MASPTIFVYSADRSVQEISPSSPLAVSVVEGSEAQYGPPSPTLIGALQNAVVDLAASTNNQQIIAAPGAGKQIWVYGLFMMADTAAGTVLLEDSAGTALTGTIAISDEGGFVLPISGNMLAPWIKVGGNLALRADTGACTVDGIIVYSVVTP